MALFVKATVQDVQIVAQLITKLGSVKINLTSQTMSFVLLAEELAILLKIVWARKLESGILGVPKMLWMKNICP